MAEAFHHGPEIIERKEAAGTIREVKSAVTFIVGTAPIHLIAETAEDRAALINKRIIIRKREDIAVQLGPNTEGYSLPQALEAIFNKVDRGQGGGTIIAVNVFDPDIHKDGTAPDPSKVAAIDIIGKFDSAGTASGFKLAYGCFNAYGYFPKILLAPRFSTLPGVRAEMEIIGNKIKAIHLDDLPLGLTIQQALEERGTAGLYNTNSERALLFYPQVKAVDSIAGDIILQPYSQHYAGVMIATDLADGYHYSPSNRAMADVYGMERDITYYPGEYGSDTNALNAAGIITIKNHYGTGFRTWGNRSSAFPTSTDMRNFVHARRIFDMVHEAALYYLDERTDGLGSLDVIDLVEEDVNAFLRKKEGEKALYGGRFNFDRQKTTSRSVADCQYFYRMSMMPTGIMERVTVDSYLDLKFAKTALGLSE